MQKPIATCIFGREYILVLKPGLKTRGNRFDVYLNAVFSYQIIGFLRVFVSNRLPVLSPELIIAI